jgi:hypothetical protein
MVISSNASRVILRRISPWTRKAFLTGERNFSESAAGLTVLGQLLFR